MNPPTSTSSTEDYVRNQLSDTRWIHTKGVLKVAESLAETYAIPEVDLTRASLLHDVARSLPEDRQRELAESFLGELNAIEMKTPGLWHAPAGAQKIIEDRRLAADDPVVNAVGYHTTGYPDPSNILMGLLVADFSEPNRERSESDEVRHRIGQVSLRDLARSVLRHKIQWVLSKNSPVHPRSLDTYNSLCD